MRQNNKYKKYSNLKDLSPNIPSRILRFQRPKWKNFQKKLATLNKNSNFFINPFIIKTSNKYWEKSTDNFRNEFQLKRFLINSFDSSVKISNLKKSLKVSSKKITKELLINYLVKPLFRLDILLTRLYLFSSSYQARQFISNGSVKVNNKKVLGNFSVSKGDIISFDFSNFNKNLDFSTVVTTFLNNELFYSFVEIDFYTKTLIILKNPQDLILEDLNLLIINHFDIQKLK